MDRRHTSPPRVAVSRGPISLPTYLPGPPDRNPMFLDKRVYQGSSGKVYPLPFIDRIAKEKVEVEWEAVHIENEFLKLMILPQIGGRIHVGFDKASGYDFFYRQEVIKPALVGLAGPWISGGVEFNWPQHHRPSSFLPTDVEVEEHEDGSKTVWLSEHEPMNRMKGMHGVCLHPGKAVIELKARVYNRTELVQTFLWWANVATRAHEHYQSFFPPDVFYVADHAKRSLSSFPLCKGHYYGVDYLDRAKNGIPAGQRPAQFVAPGSYPANDLSWYGNIPVPTSYMAMGSQQDFFGGYDHRKQAGLVHVADHLIAPGKKQWTWGNHAFGYAWDRNLTDPDAKGEFAPYVELMAGVYTDNQPDFSFLAPGETKSWSQFWYPIQKIGVPQSANANAAISLRKVDGKLRVGVAVSEVFKGARIVLQRKKDQSLVEAWQRDLSPCEPFVAMTAKALRGGEADYAVIVRQGDRELVRLTPQKPVASNPQVPPPATEPPLPDEISTNDELYVTGLHLQQYRHATRMPEPYWREALRRDPQDARCNNALGLWHLSRGEFADAEAHFRRSIARQTMSNPNPADGEAYYNLGLALRHLDRDPEAYAAFYKATWNYAWQSAGYFAIAELDCRKGDWGTALDHLDRCLRVNADHLKARNLRALALRRLNRHAEAERLLSSTRAIDPGDLCAQWLLLGKADLDLQTKFDVALDFARAGFYREALELLRSEANRPGRRFALAKPGDPRRLGTAPLLSYYRGWLHQMAGQRKEALKHFARGAKASPHYCFPARLEEIAIFRAAIAAGPKDARAQYYLGNLLYDRNRRREAIQCWEISAKLDRTFPTVWRNLGIAYYNVLNRPDKARSAYEKAVRLGSSDARLLYERDQLWKRLAIPPRKRLKELERRLDQVARRDDFSLELCALYNQTGQAQKALEILSKRNFQPWEGGEGQVLGQHVRTHLALGRSALSAGDARAAKDHFEAALAVPGNLGEARHLLANPSDIHYWLGVAWEALGNRAKARKAWTAAANFRGDFQEMSVKSFSEMTIYTALALRRLGQNVSARRLLQGLLDYGRGLARARAKIDYFATSLPTMLVFEEDLQFRQETTSLFLQALAHLGLGRRANAARLLERVIERDPNHALAADLRSTALA